MCMCTQGHQMMARQTSVAPIIGLLIRNSLCMCQFYEHWYQWCWAIIKISTGDSKNQFCQYNTAKYSNKSSITIFLYYTFGYIAGQLHSQATLYNYNFVGYNILSQYTKKTISITMMYTDNYNMHLHYNQLQGCKVTYVLIHTLVQMVA